MNTLRLAQSALIALGTLGAQAVLASAELASVNAAGSDAGDGSSFIPSEELRSFSTDGRFVAFTSSATDLVPADTNGQADVFVRDLQAGTTELISINASGDDSGNGRSTRAQVSADGRYVLFLSDADDLVANDSNTVDDVFLHDRQIGSTILVSANAAGSDSGNGASNPHGMTPDGRLVVFSSAADDLGPNDTNGVDDVYLRDVEAGTTMLISVNAAGDDAGGGGTFSGARHQSISDDGRFVAFSSDATDLDASITDSNGLSDGFLRDVAAMTTTLISTNASGDDSANGSTSDIRISADGSTIAIATQATNVLNVTDNNAGLDIYVVDRQSGTKSLVTVNDLDTGTGDDGARNDPRLSADGRFIAWESRASDLIAGADSNAMFDVFLRDLDAGSTVLASANGNGTNSGNDASEDAQISDDGRFVYFESRATDLTTISDSNGEKDTFVFDSLSGEVVLVSSNAAGNQTGNGFSYDPVVSPGGRFVQMDSGASDLDPSVADTNGITDVYVADIASLVANEDPVAGFMTTTDGLEVEFMDTSADTDGAVQSWQWDFGDGSDSTERDPSHRYATGGTYTASLAITDNLGGSDTTSRAVSVGGGGGGGASGPALIGGLLVAWLLRRRQRYSVRAFLL